MRILFYILLILTYYSPKAQSWEKVKHTASLLIEKQIKAPANNYGVRITSTLPAPLNSLEKQIENVNEYTQWLYRYKFAEITKTTHNGFIFRAIIASPIPFKNRKIKVKVTKKQTLTETNYTLKNLPITDPKFCPNCKTVSKMQAYWRLKKITNTKTEIQNCTQMEIVLPLPQSLIYNLLYKGPRKTFEKLQQLYP